jgi:hypothetical protein
MKTIHELKIKSEVFYNRHKEVFPAFFFFSGFFFDILTLGRIDELSNILIQLLYLGLASCLLVLEFSDFINKKQKNKLLYYLQKYHQETFHFLLGSLLSAFALFFFKSSSIANSFLFIILFIVILVVNEFKAFQKLGKVIRFLLLLLCYICYFILLVPIILGIINSFVFMGSIALSALFLFGFYKFLSKLEIIPEMEGKRIILFPGSAMISGFIILYFLQIIPPVPLSLEKIGIYHKVERAYPVYKLYHERPWYRFWQTGDQRYIARPGDKLFVFVRIFSPGGFSDAVVLHWMKDVNGTYKTSDRIRINIKGGRGKGYRGISFKSNYETGQYRVKVETLSGLEIGRINLEVINASKEDLAVKRIFKIDSDS